MAKKARQSKKPAAKPPLKRRVKADEVVTLINAKQLVTLLRSNDRHQEGIDGLTSALRTDIKTAVDKNHLDKEAYAIIRKFWKWTPEKLADKWPVILAYMDMSGLMKRIESIQPLPLGDGADKGEEEPESEDERTAGAEPALAEGEAAGAVH